MHLAIVCERLTLHDDVADQARLLAEQFARQGHRVSLLAAVGLDAVPNERIQVRIYGRRWWRFALGLLGFRHWLRSNLTRLQPDHTIALSTLHSADLVIPCEGTAAQYVRALRGMRAPLPVRIGAWFKSVSPAMLLRCAWERRVLADPASQVIVADNDLITDGLRSITQADPARIKHVEPALPAEPIAPPQAALLRKRLARALDLSEDAAWLVFPFRSAWLDGFEPLMLAFKALIDRGADAVLFLAGPCRYTQLAWIAQLGLRDRVRFLGRPDHPGQFIAAADLLVQPTQHDPAGAWPLAALAQGRPVLTTAASGAAPRVKTSNGTVLASPAEPGLLADALESLVKSALSARQDESGTLSTDTVLIDDQRRAQAILALLEDPQPAPSLDAINRP